MGNLKGFTTLEVVVALSLFLGLVTSVLVASFQAASTSVRTEARLAIVRAVEARLDELAAGNFDALLADSFIAPDACVDNDKSSCVQVHGSDVTITYAVAASADLLVGAGSSSSFIDVVATAVSADDLVVSSTRRVQAPVAGYSASTATVRVRAVAAFGTTSLESSLPAVMMLNAADDVVAEAVPFSNGTAVFRVDPTRCEGALSPCRVALSASPQTWFTAGGWTLAPEDIVHGASVVPAAGAIVDVAIAPARTARLDISLFANGAAALLQAPPASAEGTVCLWATFTVSGETRSVPYCNIGAASKQGKVVRIASWPLVVGSQTLYVPFSANMAMKVSVDHPSGVCPSAANTALFFPASGTYQGGFPSGFDGASKVLADICTSYTWGVPATVRSSSGADTALPNVAGDRNGTWSSTLAAGATKVKLLWGKGTTTDLLARPASGGPGLSFRSWTKPRSLTATGNTACSTDGSAATLCVSEVTVPYESLFLPAPGCPPTDPHCLSTANAAPYVESASAPSTAWPAAAVQSAGVNQYAVYLTAFGPEASDSLQVIYTKAPTGAWAAGGTPLTSLLNIPIPATAANMTLIMFSTASPPLTDPELRLKVRDAVSGAESAETSLRLIANTSFPASIAPTAAIELPQAEPNAQVNVLQQAVSSAALSLTPGGLSTFVTPAVSASTPAPTVVFANPSFKVNSSGIASLVLSTSSTPAGTYLLELRNNDLNPSFVFTHPFEVTQTPITLTAANDGPVGQGGTITAAITLLDAAGAAYAGADVELTVRRNGSPTALVRPQSGFCTTDAAGTCSTPLLAAPNAPSGTYILTATHGSLTAMSAVTVTSEPARITLADSVGASDLYAKATLEQPGIVGFWPLDDDTDASAAAAVGDAGSFFGDVTLRRARLATGDAAITLDGDGARMCTAPVTLSSPASIEAWVSPLALKRGFSPYISEVFGTEQLGGATFGLRVGDSYNSDADQFQLTVASGSTTFKLDSATRAKVGGTYHLVGTYDGSTMRLFVNGVLEASRTLPAGTVVFDGTYCVGNYSGVADVPAGIYDRFLAGTVDNVALYSVPLTAETVARRYALGAAQAGGVQATVDVRQGESVAADVHVLDATGAAVPGVTVFAATSSSRYSLGGSPSATAVTDGSGRASFTVQAGTTAATAGLADDPIEFAVPSAGLVVRAAVDIEPVPASIAAPATTVPAGGAIDLLVSLTDLTGAPMSFAPLLTAIDGSGVSLTSATATDASGVAAVRLKAQPDAMLGARTLTLSSGGVTGTAAITVSAPVASFQILDPLTVRQGGTATFRLRVLGSDGNALAGVTPAVSCAACGLGFTTSLSADNGEVAVTVTDVAAANPAGSVKISIAVPDALAVEESFTVVAQPTTITDVAGNTALSLSLPSGGSARFPIVVRDATGRPLANVPVTLTSSDGLTALTAGTGSLGRAELDVAAPVSPSAYTATITAGSLSVPVQVVVE